MKKVLIISYFFPPSGGGGIQRTLKFIKYLPKFNWQPFVLTSHQKGYCHLQKEEANQISKNIKIKRTLCPFYKFLTFPGFSKPNLKNFLLRILKWPLLFFIPDQFMGWTLTSRLAGLKSILEEKIDLIYTTGPPFSTHLLGNFLKKKTHLPWVADFRDSWVTNQHLPQNIIFKIQRQILKIYEKKVVQRADMIVCNTEPMRQDFIQRYSHIKQDKFVTITNGFDSEDFANLKSKIKNAKFTLTYTGSFAGLQTPKFFVQALKKLIIDQPDFKKNLLVQFIGNFSQDEQNLFQQPVFKNIVQVIPETNYLSTLKYQRQADVLLLILSISTDQGGDKIYCGKMFEYLNQPNPILTLVPQPSISADLIKNLQAGPVVEFNNIQGIQQAILNLYQQWQNDTLIRHLPTNKIKKFDRRYLTQHLSQIFDNLF
ncbi:MAG: glycosyltransferase [Patescibacteria group bacterium]|nr:glycosyltransferase [Patescibacteria group bacterium]